jgi:hypothetical protein
VFCSDYENLHKWIDIKCEITEWFNLIGYKLHNFYS